MENLINKIRAVEPTKEQLKDRTPEYAFGWVDSLNAITEVVKNNVDLHNVSQRSELLFALLEWIDYGDGEDRENIVNTLMKQKEWKQKIPD